MRGQYGLFRNIKELTSFVCPLRGRAIFLLVLLWGKCVWTVGFRCI